MKVYVLCGGHDYEGCSTLEVFRALESADSAKEKIEAHKRLEPRCPDKDAADSEWTKWDADSDEWRKGLCGTSNYDSYWIEEHEVKP